MGIGICKEVQMLKTSLSKLKKMLPVHTKSKEFAIAIVKLGMRLQKTNKEFNLSNQLIRSATSINANLHEARQSFYCFQRIS